MAPDAVPPVPTTLPADAVTPLPPTHLPPNGAALPPPGLPAVPGYVIHGEIAHGGMGAVLRAEDTRLGRELAVKVLLAQCQGDAALAARFVAEAKLQGRLQHPGIVPVHELGEYGPSRPFFSMKLVQGRTLAALLKERTAGINPAARPGPPDERRGSSPPADLPRFVQLFEQVCQAVAYAHAQGVIHRDLKPANVMVGAFGEVQVMDWGLAKVVGAEPNPPGPPSLRGKGGDQTGDVAESAPRCQADLPPSPLRGGGAGGGEVPPTQDGAILGTPAYMAPEQARGEIDRLNERTDVFALGAMLCEILTGQPPYPGPTALDMLGQAQEADLADAAARLDGCGADAELVALARACLAAAPAGRPADAGAVATAVAAYRAGVQDRLRTAEVAQAAATERLVGERQARRLLTALAGVFLAGLAATTGLAAWALTEKDRADGQTTLARSEQARAETAAAEATRQARFAHEVNAFLRDDLLALAGVRAQMAGRQRGKKDLRVRDVLDRAARQLAAGRRFTDQPLVEAAIRATIGAAYLDAGEPLVALAHLDRALNLYRQHLGADHPDTLVSGYILGVGYLDAGRGGEAVRHLEETHRRRAALFGADHPITLGSRIGLAIAYRAAGQTALARSLLEAALPQARATLGPDHPDTLACMSHLAGIHRTAGRWAEALALLEAAVPQARITLGPNHPDTLSLTSNLALGYEDAGRWAEGLALLEAALPQARTTLGADHPDTLILVNNLAVSHRLVGHTDQALALLEAAVPLARDRLGPGHPTTLGLMVNLGRSFLAAGRLAAARALLETALPPTRDLLGPDHPDTVQTTGALAETYLADGRTDQALGLLEAALPRAQERLGPDHPNTLVLRNHLASAYQAMGRRAEAVTQLAAVVAGARTRLGLDHPETLLYEDHLAGALRAVGRWAEALPRLEAALPRARARLGPDHHTTLALMNNLGGAYQEAGQRDRALPLMEETARLTEAQLGPTHADTLRCKNNLAGIYRATGRLTQALPLLEAVLQGLQDRLGPDDPATLTCAYNLALTYRSAGRLDRAVPLLEATLRRTQARVGADHPDTLSTQAALGVVYRETHRGAEAVALLEAVHRRGRRYPELAWVGDVLLATYLQAGPKDRAVPLIAANLAAARKSLPAGSPELASQLAEVGSQFLQADAFAAGEPVLRECLTLRENLAAGDKPAVAAWQVANTRSMLGAALLGQGKHAEAEPLLVQGWEGLKAQEKTIPPQGRINLPAALARLVQLYEATAKPLAASPYRAELARRLTAELHRDLAWSLLWGWPR